MRFAKPIHWAEGLFLEPHHMQRSQANAFKLAWQSLALSTPYAYGFIDCEIDEEALSASRVVINRFSAIMPDGTPLSMPGNCQIAPLQLDPETCMNTSEPGSGIMIYLSLPLLSRTDSNLGSRNSNFGRYVLSEETMLDENSGDNEVVIITREYHARLTTKEQTALSSNGSCALPLCRVKWSGSLTAAPQLQADPEYMPPFITITEQCPLLTWAHEFLFMLKNCRVSLESDLEKDGFDPKLITGSDLLRLNQLSALNSFIAKAENLLHPGRCTPFTLCLELCDLLGRLSGLNPLIHTRAPQYVHENAWPVFKELALRIRSLLNRDHDAGEFGGLAFTTNVQGMFGIFNLPDNFFNSGHYYLALSFDGNLKERVSAIENGDNFRLLDQESFKDRVRGVKLSHLRYPPHFLPNLSRTIWFKLMVDESLKVWNYIHEDRAMVIDYVPALFPDLKATIYFSSTTSTSSALGNHQANSPAGTYGSTPNQF